MASGANVQLHVGVEHKDDKHSYKELFHLMLMTEILMMEAVNMKINLKKYLVLEPLAQDSYTCFNRVYLERVS
jgi:hypothetical protein